MSNCWAVMRVGNSIWLWVGVFWNMYTGIDVAIWIIIINPFTPKGDQFQNFPAASPEISHHTEWRTWLSIAYSDEDGYTTNSHHIIYTFLFERLGECTFWTWEWKSLAQQIPVSFCSLSFGIGDIFKTRPEKCLLGSLKSWKMFDD